MERATLLLSGVPRYVPLADLSYHLNLLFNTDDIGTFRARDLPNHPQTNQRQIALDFMSSYDAMVAQEKLEGYQYEMQDGRQYPLRAKINKCEEYMQSMQIEWSEWPSMALIPHLDGEAYHRANARLHHGYNESEASSKRSRSRSRDHRSGSWHRRSRSRDRHGDRSSRYRSRSKERVPKYPQIEWHNHHVERSGSYGKRSRQPRELRDRLSSQESIHRAERSPARKRLRELRSMSKEHIVQSKKRSRSKDKELRSMSKEHIVQSKKRSRSKDKELRSMSKEHIVQSKKRSRSKDKELRSMSKEHIVQSKKRSRSKDKELRSMSKEHIVQSKKRSRSKDKELRSMSKEHIVQSKKRSRSKDKELRSMSKEHIVQSKKRSRSKDKELRSMSKEHIVQSKERSRSKDKTSTSKDRVSKEPSRNNHILFIQQIPQETVIIDSVGKQSSPLTLKQEKTQDVEKEEKTKEKDVIIDLDSANKPVPRNPQFVVVIKTLCKQMNKTGGLNNLLGKERVRMKEFSYVLRHILRNLLKGQGHLPRAQITCKFREIYPICNDKEFIKNVIQDIKDGKYPGCLDHIDITSEDDQPDDVIVIENQYDTVTLSDSEVDDQPDDVIVIENQYDTVTLSDSEDEDNKSLEVVQNMPCPPDCSQNVLDTNIPHPNTAEVSPGQIRAEQDSNVSHKAVEPVTKQLSTQEQPKAPSTMFPDIPDTLNLQSKENEEESQLASGDINSSHPDNNDDTEKIQGNETNKFIDNPAQDNIDTKETRENDGNDLRVTAITIMTSLSELLTKTTNEPREEPVTDIKEELEYEEEKLDESSLQLVPDNVPKVTSITIMTSDAELFSICQDGGKKVSDIKSEDYDAEESLLNDIKRDIENDKFNLQMDDHLNHIEQNYSVIDSNTSNALNSSNVSQTNDDDETNESIRRYVASLF